MNEGMAKAGTSKLLVQSQMKGQLQTRFKSSNIPITNKAFMSFYMRETRVFIRRLYLIKQTK